MCAGWFQTRYHIVDKYNSTKRDFIQTIMVTLYTVCHIRHSIDDNCATKTEMHSTPAPIRCTMRRRSGQKRFGIFARLRRCSWSATKLISGTTRIPFQVSLLSWPFWQHTVCPILLGLFRFRHMDKAGGLDE